MQAPFRCPNCGAVTEWKKVGTDNKGFSVGKAVTGGLFFGPIGLVGGAMGKRVDTYFCGKCGFRNDYDADSNR